MAPPAAQASYGFGWIAVQGAVCAAIAFGAYYVFSTPNIMPGASPKPSFAQQTIAVVQRATAEAPVQPAPAPPKAQPPPNPEQEAASRIMGFLGKTPPTDRTFAACAKQINSEPAKLVQKFIQGDHDSIARMTDCYLNWTPARLCEPEQRAGAMEMLTIYYATKRAQIAAEKNRPGQPVVAAGRWDSTIDKTVRARFRNAIINGYIPPAEVAAASEYEMQAVGQDVKPAKQACLAGAATAAAVPAFAPVTQPEPVAHKPAAKPAAKPAPKKKKV